MAWPYNNTQPLAPRVHLGFGHTKSSFPGAPTSTTKQATVDKVVGVDPQEALYRQMMQQHQAQWGEEQKGLEWNAARAQRQAMAQNAMMGRAIGGGFAGMLTGAYANSQQQWNQARGQWENEAQQMAMDRLRQKQEEERQRQANELQLAAVASQQGKY